MAIYKGPTQNFVSTTLNGSINDAVTSITLNDASKLQYPGYIIIDREDGNGTATPNSREVVSYTGITTNTLTGCTRAADGSTARSHSDGALVEAVLTSGMWTSVRDTLAAITSDGTDLAITATASISALRGATMALSSNASVPWFETKNLAVSSIASISRVENLWLESKNVAISSVASIKTLTITTNINASGASVFGFPSGFNAHFQVPGSLASYADIGGMVIAPNNYTNQYMIGYVKTPASIASVSAFIVKQGGAVVGMLTILGGTTYGSSASLAVASLVAGDVLGLDVRSTASLAADLSVVLRTA